MTTDSFADVWDALEDTPADAAHMRARADIMTAIQETARSWDITQALAAARLGIIQPRLNDLLRGRINKFSLDALITLAMAAGLSVEWRIIRPAA